MSRLAKAHTLVDPMHDLPTGPDRTINEAEIAAQNPKGTSRLLKGVDVVFRASCRTYAWGLDNIPETGPFITAATHVTMYDVFVPMASLFHMGRRPRYMAKAEMAHWPLIGRWFQIVGMQPVQRRSGKARAIEETSVEILTSGRPLTVWPEGTVTRDPKKWPMSMKNGVGVIALEASRRLGYQVPLFCAVTWGAASINTGGRGRARTSSCATTRSWITLICWSTASRGAMEPPVGARRRADPPGTCAHDAGHGGDSRRACSLRLLGLPYDEPRYRLIPEHGGHPRRRAAPCRAGAFIPARRAHGGLVSGAGVG